MNSIISRRSWAALYMPLKISGPCFSIKSRYWCTCSSSISPLWHAMMMRLRAISASMLMLDTLFSTSSINLYVKFRFSYLSGAMINFSSKYDFSSFSSRRYSSTSIFLHMESTAWFRSLFGWVAIAICSRPRMIPRAWSWLKTWRIFGIVRLDK